MIAGMGQLRIYHVTASVADPQALARMPPGVPGIAQGHALAESDAEALRMAADLARSSGMDESLRHDLTAQPIPDDDLTKAMEPGTTIYVTKSLVRMACGRHQWLTTMAALALDMPDDAAIRHVRRKVRKLARRHLGACETVASHVSTIPREAVARLRLN